MKRSFSIILASHANILINEKLYKILLVKMFTITLTQLKNSLLTTDEIERDSGSSPRWIFQMCNKKLTLAPFNHYFFTTDASTSFLLYEQDSTASYECRSVECMIKLHVQTSGLDGRIGLKARTAN